MLSGLLSEAHPAGHSQESLEAPGLWLGHRCIPCISVSISARVMGWYRQVIYCRRELHAITTLLGMVANAALSKGLKRMLRQARPLAGCERLGSCMKHGMPSSHVQLMFFVWALHALLVFCRRPRCRAQSLLQIAESAVLGAVAVAVAAGRVYLGYHDISQVCNT